MNINEYQVVLEKFHKLPKELNKPTMLEIAGYPSRENVCNNILKFFLTPNAVHGLHGLVLKAILKTVGYNSKDLDMDTVEVFREYRTDKNNRIDIVITSNKLVIGIECKLFHGLYNDLDDYSRTIEKLSGGKKATLKILLTLFQNGYIFNTNKAENDLIGQESHGFIQITFRDFFKNIQEELQIVNFEPNNVYRFQLEDLISTIQNLNGPRIMNKELASFFSEYALTISELIEQFNAYSLEKFKLIDNLKDEIERLKQNNEIDLKYFEIWIWEGKEEGVFNSRGLVFEFEKDQRKYSLNAILNLSIWELHIKSRNEETNNYVSKTIVEKLEENSFELDFRDEGDLKVIVIKKLDLETEVKAIAQECSKILKLLKELQ